MSEDEVSIQVWVRDGTMLVNAYALNPDHEMHPYNQILSMGKRPEDYGMQHPYYERFKDSSREDLMRRIVDLEREITAYAKADAMGVLEKTRW